MAQFIQSALDFPLHVTLGKELPSWEFSGRFKESLRFKPPVDEGFMLRGDRQRLLYKGRQKSHRFTILNDGAFEYDCILEKEPDNNMVRIGLEGAHKYDFYRQPDFIRDPFLRGSYAVYKKDTFIGEGTGKLCHIHRPKIIDARGRSVWGELFIEGDDLCIRIPEMWLGEAAYPVIVDPVIGTQTIGTLSEWVWDIGEDPESLFVELSIAVNRFLVPETFDGFCTAYAYTNKDFYGDAGGRPVIYSDLNDIPRNLRTSQEGFFDFEIKSNKPPGWRNTTFRTNGSIANGSKIWFGVFSEYFWFPRFDVGPKSYSCFWDDCVEDVEAPTIPEVFPMKYPNMYDNFRYSMFFTYSSVQNYVLKLTQGVMLTDSQKKTSGYIRKAIDFVKGSVVLNHLESFYRYCFMVVLNIEKSYVLFSAVRRVLDKIQGSTELNCKRGLNREILQNVSVKSNKTHSIGFLRLCIHQIMIQGKWFSHIIRFRYIGEHEIISDIRNKWATYFKRLLETIDDKAEIDHQGKYIRSVFDFARPKGITLRCLGVIIRLVTTGIIRDYIHRLFLKSKEEIVLKSDVCREIILESKIH